MAKEVQIAVNMKDLDSESGNNLVFKIPFKRLALALIKPAIKMANDYKNPIRLNAANVYTTLLLLLDAMGEDVEYAMDEDVETPKRVGKKTFKEGEKEEILGNWHIKFRGKKPKKSLKVKVKRKKRVCGKRPSNEQLLEFRKNGAFHKDIAKLYGVDTSTVCGWIKSIKQT